MYGSTQFNYKIFAKQCDLFNKTTLREFSAKLKSVVKENYQKIKTKEDLEHYSTCVAQAFAMLKSFLNLIRQGKTEKADLDILKKCFEKTLIFLDRITSEPASSSELLKTATAGFSYLQTVIQALGAYYDKTRTLVEKTKKNTTRTYLYLAGISNKDCQEAKKTLKIAVDTAKSAIDKDFNELPGNFEHLSNYLDKKTDASLFDYENFLQRLNNITRIKINPQDTIKNDLITFRINLEHAVKNSHLKASPDTLVIYGDCLDEALSAFENLLYLRAQKVNNLPIIGDLPYDRFMICFKDALKFLTGANNSSSLNLYKLKIARDGFLYLNQILSAIKAYNEAGLSRQSQSIYTQIEHQICSMSDIENEPEKQPVAKKLYVKIAEGRLFYKTALSGSVDSEITQQELLDSGMDSKRLKTFFLQIQPTNSLPESTADINSIVAEYKHEILNVTAQRYHTETALLTGFDGKPTAWGKQWRKEEQNAVIDQLKEQFLSANKTIEKSELHEPRWGFKWLGAWINSLLEKPYFNITPTRTSRHIQKVTDYLTGQSKLGSVFERSRPLFLKDKNSPGSNEIKPTVPTYISHHIV